ncbi:U-scoloptoxin(05)-Cw1a isoform X3 [Bombus pyrosoma]|uniref:U-scoloptoxin(05)-Cw1a isoform X3 n=1 Tax=Bombus pyrosoma TaxID=396416 RepID=UPI001CB8BC72|nr:U-scoloptoxin(05)-Cw1a isoform X3 [Bombus pyrosoma]
MGAIGGIRSYTFFAAFLLFVESATSLDCYQCTSEEELSCGDSNLVISTLQPTNCSHVYNAQYCIVSVGRFGGGIGTKRFCSALDLGNYCDYVKQQGDKLSYRTCIFTCTGDGCNPAAILIPNIASMVPVGLLVVYELFFVRFSSRDIDLRVRVSSK